MAPIAIVGEALIDVFADAEVAGGAPFNVARHLVAFGAPTILVTRVGRDARGRELLAEMARFGIDARDLQVDAQWPTGHVNVHLDGASHRFEMPDAHAWDRLGADAAVQAVVASPPAIICFGTLAQRHATSRSAIRAALSATSAPRVLDLNLRGMRDERTVSEASLSFADTVKVNDEELAQLIAWFVPGQDETALMRRFDVSRLVTTRGAAGRACVDSVLGASSGPAPAVDVVDTVGAGDAFTAVLLLGDALGWPLEMTLARAAMFSSSACTWRGAVCQDDAVYQAALQHWS